MAALLFRPKGLMRLYQLSDSGVSIGDVWELLVKYPHLLFDFGFEAVFVEHIGDFSSATFDLFLVNLNP